MDYCHECLMPIDDPADAALEHDEGCPGDDCTCSRVVHSWCTNEAITSADDLVFVGHRFRVMHDDPRVARGATVIGALALAHQCPHIWCVHVANEDAMVAELESGSTVHDVHDWMARNLHLASDAAGKWLSEVHLHDLDAIRPGRWYRLAPNTNPDIRS